jgi:uncharacterized protein YegJ (DUF2314 family)
MLGRFGTIAVMALAVFAVGKISKSVHGSEAPFVVVANEDAEVNAAHAKARQNIGQFWAALDRHDPGEKNFSLKVRFPVPASVAKGDNGEHMWVLDVARAGNGSYSGRLDNVPRFLPSMHAGDRVTFSDNMISDWMFTRNGKIVGNESMRPLLARLPDDKAAKLRQMLETP